MKKRIIILGGGIGGLSAGWMLARTEKYHITVVERASTTGGVCGTFQFENFLLDYGPHKSYSAMPEILDELNNLMAEEFIQHVKSNSIYLFNSYLKYPVSMIDLAFKMGLKNLFQSGLSVAVALGKKKEKESNIKSYEDYVLSKFGRKIYELVFEPLAEKVWGDPSTLSSDIARTRIPSTSIFDVASRALGLKKESALTDAKTFFYPRRGFGRIPARMQEEIQKFGGSVLTSTTPLQILREGKSITGVELEYSKQRRILPCDILISSIQIDQLVSLISTGEETELKVVMQNATKLKYRTAFLSYIVLNKDKVTNNHWIFFPGRNIIFGRVFEQKQMSSEMIPKDKTVLCCDFTDYENGPLSNQTDAQLIEKCICDLEKIGMIKKSWVEKSFLVRLPKFYPRYDIGYKETITEIYNSLRNFDNLILTGRIGFYNYNNSDHCVDMGKFIANNLSEGKSTSQIWTDLEQRVKEYRIVD